MQILVQFALLTTNEWINSVELQDSYGRIVISMVQDGSVASKILRPDDILVKINNQPIPDKYTAKQVSLPVISVVTVSTVNNISSGGQSSISEVCNKCLFVSVHFPTFISFL